MTSQRKKAEQNRKPLPQHMHTLVENDIYVQELDEYE